METVIGAGVLVLVAFLVFALQLLLRQGRLVFRPSRVLAVDPGNHGLDAKRRLLGSANGYEIPCWHLEGTRDGPVVLFLHGNRGNLTFEIETLGFLRSLGAGVIAPEYPGYGDTAGRPSEEGCYAAADAAWSHATHDLGVREENLYLFGFSLGGGVATYLAFRRSCGGLVLQSSFTSVPDVAAGRYPFLPVRPFCFTRMNSLARLPQCPAPTLLVHSRDDREIPYHHSESLYDAVRGKRKLVTIGGGHDSGGWRENRSVREAWRQLLEGDLATWDAGSSDR